VLHIAHHAPHSSFSLLLLDLGIAATPHPMICKIDFHPEEQIYGFIPELPRDLSGRILQIINNFLPPITFCEITPEGTYLHGKRFLIFSVT
jgi:hypothetical protein